MHAITFSIKRCHLQKVRFHQKFIRWFGLTPARFDMMYAIRKAYGGSIQQSELRCQLGVSRPTVSRMLKSLEQLGLVRRKVSTDQRTRQVWLTEEGKQCIRRAMRECFDTWTLEWAIGSALTKEWWSDAACFAQMLRLCELLDSYRNGYLDRATLHYPWHPDD